MKMRGIAVWMAVLLLLGGGIYVIRGHLPAGQAKQGHKSQIVTVVAQPAKTENVPVYLDGLGTVQAFNTVTIRAMIDGPLISINFRQGQNVRVGDVLARIDPRPYQATLDQDLAKKAQDQANLANARLDLARYDKLVKNKYTSAQSADTQRATVAADEALVKQDDALIEAARTQLSYTTITSPINGRTGIRQVDIGNIVHPTDTSGIVVITQLQPIYVLFTLPQQTLPQITAAMRNGEPDVIVLPQGDVTGGARPNDPDVLDRGKLVVLDNEVDSSTGTLKMRAAFPNTRLTLWPGGFVNARLLVNTLQNVVTVPPLAVQRGPNGAFLYVLNANDTVSRRMLKLGYEDQVASVVRAGVRPGEQVVTVGASRLSDGMHVAVAGQEKTSKPATPATAKTEKPTRVAARHSSPQATGTP